MKKKRLIIALSIIGTAVLVLCICFIFYGCLTCASKQDIDESVTYYRNDDSYIGFSAKISNVEKVGDYYRVYLQYDEQYLDLRFAEYFELIPSNVSELQKNEFNIDSIDKTYFFTVGRKKFHNGPASLITYPIVEVRETDNDGKIYLSYETGKNNILSYLESKQ